MDEKLHVHALKLRVINAIGPKFRYCYTVLN